MTDPPILRIPFDLWTQVFPRVTPVPDLIRLLSTCRQLQAILKPESDFWKQLAQVLWKTDDSGAVISVNWKKEFALMYKVANRTLGNRLEASPSQLLDNCAYISEDGLEFHYTAENTNENEVYGIANPNAIAVAQAKYPVQPLPFGRCNVSYFEIQIVKLNPLRGSGFGLAPKGLQTAMPGWCSYTVGFHGDDGHIYFGRDIGEKLSSEPWNEGDVIGCGINYVTLEVFFTLNGKLLAPPKGKKYLIRSELVPFLFPTIAIFRKEVIRFNFGAEPFVFDILRYQYENSPSTFIFVPLSKRVRNLDGKQKITDQDWFELEDYMLKDFGITPNYEEEYTDLIIPPSLAETEKYLKLNLEMHSMLQDESVDINDHKPVLTHIYEAYMGEPLPNADQLTDAQFREEMINIVAASILYQSRTIVEGYITDQSVKPRPTSRKELELQLSVKIYVLLNCAALPTTSRLVQLAMDFCRNVAENGNFNDMDQDQIRSYLQAFMQHVLYTQMDNLNTLKKREQKMRRRQGVAAEPEPNFICPRFRPEAIAPMLTVLESTEVPDTDPLIADFIVRTWATAGFDNLEHTVTLNTEFAKELLDTGGDLKKLRQLTRQYLREEVKYIKNGEVTQDGESTDDMLKVIVDVLTNYDSTPEDVRNNVLAKLGECVMWQLVETYKPQLVPVMRQNLVDIVNEHIFNIPPKKSILPHFRRKWMPNAITLMLAAITAAAVGFGATFAFIRRRGGTSK